MGTESQYLRQILQWLQGSGLDAVADKLDIITNIVDKGVITLTFFGLLWFVVKMLRGRYNLL